MERAMSAKNIVVVCLPILWVVTLHTFMSGVLGYFPFLAPDTPLDPALVQDVLIVTGIVLFAVSLVLLCAFWRLDVLCITLTRELKNTRVALKNTRVLLKNTRAVLEHVCTQKNADIVLANFARWFDTASEEEGKVAARFAHGEECELELEMAKRATQVAKRRFWNAHKVAKVIPKIAVRTSYRNYLSGPRETKEAAA